nr:MAG TPA: hypothetical protein [Caudoviricetes sp.]
METISYISKKVVTEKHLSYHIIWCYYSYFYFSCLGNSVKTKDV